MPRLATTKMSSRGQVVIPEEIRDRLGLKAGSRFIVVGEKATIVLEAISPPSMEEFENLIAEARRQAGRAGRKRSEVTGTPTKAHQADPVVEAFKNDIDRTLIRENLKLSHEGRLQNLIRLQQFADELRRAGSRLRSEDA